MFVSGSELNEQFYRGPTKDASYQVLIHNYVDNIYGRSSIKIVNFIPIHFSNMTVKGNSCF
jgi:hypothetical protein